MIGPGSDKKYLSSSGNPGLCPSGGSVHLLWHSYVWWDWEGWEGTVLNPYLFWKAQCVYEPTTHLFEGYNGSPIGFDWRHHGPSHWLLHPQWSRDHLLPSEVFLSSVINSFINFYSLRFFMSLKTSRTDVVSAVKKRFENHLTKKN